MNGKNVAFVASGQIPPSPPPASTTGAIGWLRENLFDGIFNSILTIVSILFIVWLLWTTIPWAFLDSVWFASSLSECREINSHGACWAVIVERFDQFIYGFYPHELRWRVNLAFVLVMVALAYALFDNMPYRTHGLIFAAVYPVFFYWLIWGGSFWFVVSFFAAFAVGYVVYRVIASVASEAIAGLPMIVGAVVTLVWIFLAVGPLTGLLQSAVPLALTEVESRELGGFMLALIIGLAGIVLSLPIGILLALGRRSGMIFFQTICVTFIEFIRGVPLITLLFVANSVLAYFFPPGENIDLILRVVIMVVLFASAYMAETIRGGLAALPPGQYEAADALGLDYWKSMRLIILPQALKISIPNIVSNFIGLFKDTTLVVVIGLLDPIGLINTTRADSAWNGIIWEFYIFVGLLFWICCFSMSRYSMYLEKKLKTDR